MQVPVGFREVGAEDSEPPLVALRRLSMPPIMTSSVPGRNCSDATACAGSRIVTTARLTHLIAQRADVRPDFVFMACAEERGRYRASRPALHSTGSARSKRGYDAGPGDGQTRRHPARARTFQSRGAEAWKSRRNSWRRQRRGPEAPTERSCAPSEIFSRRRQPKRTLEPGWSRACATIVVASLRGKCSLSLSVMPRRYQASTRPPGCSVRKRRYRW